MRHQFGQYMIVMFLFRSLGQWFVSCWIMSFHNGTAELIRTRLRLDIRCEIFRRTCISGIDRGIAGTCHAIHFIRHLMRKIDDQCLSGSCPGVGVLNFGIRMLATPCYYYNGEYSQSCQMFSPHCYCRLVRLSKILRIGSADAFPRFVSTMSNTDCICIGVNPR